MEPKFEKVNIHSCCWKLHLFLNHQKVFSRWSDSVRLCVLTYVGTLLTSTAFLLIPKLEIKFLKAKDRQNKCQMLMLQLAVKMIVAFMVSLTMKKPHCTYQIVCINKQRDKISQMPGELLVILTL